MKKILLITIFLVGCGRSSVDNETIGQVKKVVHRTPLICPNFNEIDLSLGIMRGGTGSMSSEDIWFYVPDRDVLETLKKANETGSIIKIKADKYRVTWCIPENVITSAEIVK